MLNYMLFTIILLVIFSRVQGQTTQNINVLFVNEEGNTQAEAAIRVVQEYVRRNTATLGMGVELETVHGNRTDAKGLLETLCAKYGEMLTSKKQPHLILDTTMTGVSSETVKSFSAALGLPTMSGSFGQAGDLRQWRTINATQQSYLLQVMPPADIIPEAVRSIVNTQRITNAAILFDNSFVMDHKYKSLLQNIPTRHVIALVEDGQEKIQQQLTKLRSLDIVNYFILGSVDTIEKVLDAGSKIKYFGRQYAWHAITQDKKDLKCACENATILYLKPSSETTNRDRLGKIITTYNLNVQPEIASAFYFDLALRSFLAVKDMLAGGQWPPDMNYLTCDDYDGKNSPERQIDLKTAFIKQSEPETYGPIVVPDKDTIPFNGNAYMKFQMELTAVTVRNSISVGSTPLATWTSGLNNEIEVRHDQNMENFTAKIVHRIATVVQHPFIIRDPTAEKGFKGYCIDLIEEIRKIVVFDYEIEEVEDKKFGNMDETGRWNGVVKKLIDKEADIGLGSMSVMAERENVIDFTVPYYDLVGITILMKLPKTPTSLFKFLTVLENDVWLCILAAYFFTSFLMWVFDRWSPYSYQNNREKYKDDEEKREFNLKECLWFCMTSLTPQGGGEAPKNLSGRLVAATWWLFGFIIIASYTANLAAFLTVSRLDTPVESLDDLSKQYKILYAPLNGSSAMTYFQRMADIEDRFYEIWKDMSLNDSLSEVERSKLAVWDYPVSDKYTKMWQAMQEAKLPQTMEEAVERVRASKSSSVGFAFLGDATDIRYQVLTSCDLQMVGEEFSRKPYAIAVQQGSPLKDQFNNAILQLLNKRQLEKLKETWWNNNKEKKKCEKAEDQSDGISIQNIGGVFIVIFVGIGLACITLVFEYWWYKYRKNPKIIDVSEAPPISKEKPMKAAAVTESTLPTTNQNTNLTAFRSRHQYPPTNFRSRF